LLGTSDYGLCYQGRSGLDRVLDIHGIVDVDWDVGLDQRRSTGGYVFNLFDGAISWMSKKQSVVALSTTEAEYMAATHASKEAVWLQRLCSNMGLVQGAMRIDCDSKSAIFLEKNPGYHSKKNHIDVQYHFVRDMIEDKMVLLVKVETLKNTTDALTKSSSSEKFSWCRETMGVSGLEKKISGRMLGCVIFFLRLAHVVNWGVKMGTEPPLCCTYCIAGEVIVGLRGFVQDFRSWFWMQWFSVHGFGHDGFQSIVLDALACINMYCNIERNIMKNQAGSLSFGIYGKSLCICVLCVMLSHCLFSVF